MSKYNYFDDDPEEPIQKKNRLSLLNFRNAEFRKIADNAKITFEEIAHGETLKDIKELRELPNLRALVLKITAVVLFLLAVIMFIIIFSHTISSQNNKNHQFYVDAGKVCTNYIKEYGSVKWESLNSKDYGEDMAKMTGLCYARQMDFNNDGEDELMLCYNNKNVYTLEVWGYHRKDFVNLYSEPANSTSDKMDGSWIGLYRNNNKYYICKSTSDDPETVDLYTLKGNKFVKSGQCDYDYKNDIYSVKGEINAQDFETIKLSVIKSSKAENIVNTVTANIDSFSTVSVPAIEMQKTDAQLKAEAYFDVVEKRIERYGEAKVVEKDGESYIDGVAVVRLVDFNNDGNEELLLVYRKQLKRSATNANNGEYIIVEDPTYCVEVYGWNGAIAQKLFSRDNISNYLEDTDVNYLMLQNTDNGVNICVNNYTYETSYSYTASTKIYQFEDNTFTEKLNARLENDYGYKNYYIDGEYVYRSEFRKQAYQVPKFMDDSEDVDSRNYTLIYVSGDEEKSFENTVNLTVDTIQTFDKNYTPDE